MSHKSRDARPPQSPSVDGRSSRRQHEHTPLCAAEQRAFISGGSLLPDLLAALQARGISEVALDVAMMVNSMDIEDQRAVRAFANGARLAAESASLRRKDATLKPNEPLAARGRPSQRSTGGNVIRVDFRGGRR